MVPSLGGGGAERVIATLARHLDPARCEVILAVGSLENAPYRAEVPDAVRVIDLRARQVRWAAPKLIPLIWSLRPDVVMSTLDHLNIALAATRFAWPRRTAFVARLTSTESLRRPLPRRLMAALLPCADAAVFQSEEMRQIYAAAGVTLARGTVIHNPIDLAAVRARSRAPTQTGFDPARFNFLAIGRLAPAKQFGVLLDALASLENRRTDLTLIGEGSERPALRARARALGLEERVRFLSFQDNPYPYYAAADALVVSSRFEGFPNVVLEAVACGAPVAATPVSSIGEIIGGLDQCVIAKGFDAPDIAAAMDRLAKAGRRRLDPRAADRFDAGPIALRYEAMLGAAVARRR